MPSCQCQCGRWTRGGRFLPGHDARLKGVLLRAARGVPRHDDYPRYTVDQARAQLVVLGWEHFLTGLGNGVSRSLSTTVSLVLSPIQSRTIGIEIETVGASASRIQREMIARGIPTQYESYNHQTRDYWKLVPDSSIGRSGVEVVSPILTGIEGLEQIRTVCQALSAVGARVNSRCGFHVHLGARDLTAKQIGRVVRRYSANRNLICAMLAPSRRYNNFCNPWSVYDLDAYENDPENHLRLASDRYRDVNLVAYGRYGTIEFRQHQGTINFRKMEAWIRLLQQLVEDAIVGSGDGLLENLPVATQQHLQRRVDTYNRNATYGRV